jgi:hypothetical protein
MKVDVHWEDLLPNVMRLEEVASSMLIFGNVERHRLHAFRSSLIIVVGASLRRSALSG